MKCFSYIGLIYSWTHISMSIQLSSMMAGPLQINSWDCWTSFILENAIVNL
uniref:Uncharacterized protein n=1 Tax=Rhizophora mucronata TaxID=61149 RepID=A0A2P2PCM2_RHIMU